MAVAAVKSEPAVAEPAARPAGRKGLIKLVLIAVLAAGAGAGYWYYSQQHHAPAQEAKQEPPKPPVFFPLETFTVNLQLVDNPQFLQTAITLKVADNNVVEAIKLHMPVVRDRILILMSSRKAADLLTVDGKRQLGEDIAASVNDVLAAGAGRPKTAAKSDDTKGAADAEDDAKDGAAAKDAAAGEEKAADAAERAVQAVLFTSFIIQ